MNGEIIYYILGPNQTKEHLIYENCQLGRIFARRKYLKNGPHQYFNEFIFESKPGYDILIKCIEKFKDKIHLIRIFDSKGKQLNIEQFLKKIEICKFEKGC